MATIVIGAQWGDEGKGKVGSSLIYNRMGNTANWFQLVDILVPKFNICKLWLFWSLEEAKKFVHRCKSSGRK
jgi:hypothetical protein